MKKNIILIVLSLVLSLGSVSMAYSTAVIGGIRNGTALGLMLENNTGYSPALRMGIEADTSSDFPAIAFIGGKWLLTDINNQYPMSISGGLVGYLGSSAALGPYVSLVFDRFLAISPLFLEIGIDVLSSGRMQVQLGYFF